MRATALPGEEAKIIAFIDEANAFEHSTGQQQIY
jgi:hypothetical protein